MVILGTPDSDDSTDGLTTALVAEFCNGHFSRCQLSEDWTTTVVLQRTDYMYRREAQILGSEGSQIAPARPFGTGRLENGRVWESNER